MGKKAPGRKKHPGQGERRLRIAHEGQLRASNEARIAGTEHGNVRFPMLFCEVVLQRRKKAP
jgi:hypothetical protein